MNGHIRVMHADDAMLVLDKPAGLLSVVGRGPMNQDCLASRVQAHYPDALIVHRLDMATSGLMVMARGAESQRSFSIAFAERRTRKRYVAVVAGHLPIAQAEWATIDLPLASDWPNRPKQQVDHQRGKPSLTRWRVLAHDVENDTTRVELEPVTGRSHQLRVHLLALGHPILGDALYAPPPILARADRLLLHASELTVPHPVTGDAMHFCSETPF